METNEPKPKEAFWYRVSIERVDSNKSGFVDAKDRFALTIRLEPTDMYALVKEIVEFAISDDGMGDGNL